MPICSPEDDSLSTFGASTYSEDTERGVGRAEGTVAENNPEAGDYK